MSPDREPMLPTPYRVADRRVETHDSVSLRLEAVREPLPRFRPGQFTMLYAHGVGEVPISISGDPSSATGSLTQTIRDVGAVSRALHDARPGTVLGVRGPFGTTWDLESSAGHDLLVVAGGIGLAPLRPVLLEAVAHRRRYGRVTLVAGARAPREFLFSDQLRAWRARDDLEVELTVDQPAEGWTGRVGFVTEPLAGLRLDPRRTTAFLCGPEPMMRFSANVLLRQGLPAAHIRISLERTMKCGIGLCGHCQLGPLLVCRDGPIVDYATAADLLTTREL
ncbi:FAD/NAD(P)-binding protein [Allokutzneria oryzae]|uniref:FAD/NAD(P)-binding protein n=1 Tax=Allokutzneria oryzae TaxID=1378989 RepID=A0ABV5ZWX5_9PSEU